MEERVLKNAKNFISGYGVKGWSMDDLASASGITKRTLYRIISSKEQLVHDIVFQNIDENKEAVLKILHSGPGFDEYINLIIFKIPELVKNTYIKRYKEILLEYPDLEEEIVRENMKVNNHMRDFFQSGIDRGYLRKDIDAEQVNQMLGSFLLFFVKYSDSQEEATGKIREALRYMLSGCIDREKHSEPVL